VTAAASDHAAGENHEAHRDDRCAGTPHWLASVSVFDGAHADVVIVGVGAPGASSARHLNRPGSAT
jgi:hypothetical protein